MKSWQLTYRLLKDGSLAIREAFETASAPRTPHELHFLLPAPPDLSAAGAVGLPAGLTLTYDKQVLEASSERISLEGAGFGKAFGDALWRLTLKDRTGASKGVYNLKISK